MTDKSDEYISLKEAAAISGYSSDYVGQLIRSGKISGKQIYSNVAWVTTREALEAYMSGRVHAHASSPFTSPFSKLSPEQLSRLYTRALWVGIIVMAAFVLFLVAVLAVSIDNRIEKTYLEEIQVESSL